MSTYIPTYLYIKQHTITGKLYFGKTIKDPNKYLGSGTHWKRHIEKHGKEHVVNLWYCIFDNEVDLCTFALEFSKAMNIVESSLWLNLVEENGKDGNSVKGPNNYHFGKPKSDEHKRNLSIAKTGTKHSEEHKHKISVKSSGENNGMYGKTHTNEARQKISDGHKGKSISRERVEALRKLNIGKTISDEQKKRISETHKGIPKPKTECPYCQKLVDVANGKRWHFENCKFNTVQ